MLQSVNEKETLCGFLKSCLKIIQEKHPKMKIQQISTKTGVPRSTLNRILNNEVSKTSFPHAVKIVREACGEKKVIPFLAKFFPDMALTFNKVYSDNKEIEFVNLEAEKYLEDPKSYEYMLMASCEAGISEMKILERYGNHGLETIYNLLRKGILKKENEKIYLCKGIVNASQTTVQKLLQNLVTFNYDVEAFGEKDNWLTLQYRSSNKDYVMPKLVEMLKEFNQKVRTLLNSPKAKGKDVVWLGLVMDDLKKQDLNQKKGVLQ